ncbi:hypothetical protein CEXT_181 [Caerostris extrusa]|uniref:Uncharacterized protein n=1 Tax=Caerostris extrusa TaxID=172846 RepID=A0AAV4XR70_CAEEX|nr:hypothetical protein CEXT_181 [Caerostris extrusa]
MYIKIHTKRIYYYFGSNNISNRNLSSDLLKSLERQRLNISQVASTTHDKRTKLSLSQKHFFFLQIKHQNIVSNEPRPNPPRRCLQTEQILENPGRKSETS